MILFWINFSKEFKKTTKSSGGNHKLRINIQQNIKSKGEKAILSTSNSFQSDPLSNRYWKHSFCRGFFLFKTLFCCTLFGVIWNMAKTISKILLHNLIFRCIYYHVLRNIHFWAEIHVLLSYSRVLSMC